MTISKTKYHLKINYIACCKMLKVLFETDRLKIDYEYESTYLIDKSTGSILLEDYFYGNPTCGLIDIDNTWAIIGGEHLIIWTPKIVKKVEDDYLRWIHSIRTKEAGNVEVLTDPWSEISSIWEINMKTLTFRKVKEFNDYKNQPYTENIIW